MASRFGMLYGFHEIRTCDLFGGKPFNCLGKLFNCFLIPTLSNPLGFSNLSFWDGYKILQISECNPFHSTLSNLQFTHCDDRSKRCYTRHTYPNATERERILINAILHCFGDRDKIITCCWAPMSVVLQESSLPYIVGATTKCVAPTNMWQKKPVEHYMAGLQEY